MRLTWGSALCSLARGPQPPADIRSLCSPHTPQYHHLVEDHDGSEEADREHRFSTWHMACAVTPGAPGQPEEVTFLYKLRRGSCPRSYGVNVAKLAGLPPQVISRAYAKAAELESGEGAGSAEADANACLSARSVYTAVRSAADADAAYQRLLAEWQQLQASS